MQHEGAPYEGRSERPAPRPRRVERGRSSKRRQAPPKRSGRQPAPHSTTPRIPGPRRRRSLVPLIAIVLLVAAVLLVVGLVSTSSEGFCTRSCHSVHGDDVSAFEQSTHQRTTCPTCHVDADAGGLGRFAYRLGKLGDYGPVLFDRVEQPVNALSEVALSMSPAQCTQCHVMESRRVTPSAGIVIDHAAHESAGISCTACHNRVAHPETAIALEVDGNVPKQDFMSMTACYRCHSLGEIWASEYRAPGDCAVCHTAGFDLIPLSHDAEDWYTERGASAGHAAAFKAERERAASSAGVGEGLVRVPPVAAVNECYTCHLAAFCTGCHGTEIPHPDGFLAVHSQQFSAADAVGCAKCHNKTGDAANDRHTCTLCHHPGFNPAEGAWRRRHDDVIGGGVNPMESCYACHEETYCSSCHVRGEPSTPY